MRFSSGLFFKSGLAALLIATLPNLSGAAGTPRAYGPGHPFTLRDLPFGDLRSRLDTLPEPARNRAMAWMHGFSFSERDVPYLRVDDQGGVYYADTFNGEDAMVELAGTVDGAVTESAMSAAEVFSLESRPGASKVIYLDFDGHVVSGTAWSSIDLYAVPYDTDGTPASFSSAELANIAEIWRRIAEDFAPFDVNVTTREPAVFGATTARVLITKDTDTYGNPMPSKGAGGVAYVGVWGRSDFSSRYSPAFVYYNNLGNGRPDYVAEASSHEAGHNLSLSHDGTSTRSYYSGHGSGYISWGPIMGTGYARHVSQWSKGEYADANNLQDDIGILGSKLGGKADDHVDILSAVSRIQVNADGSVGATTPETDPGNLSGGNKGVIGAAGDLDVFYFDTTGGDVNLSVTPAWQGRYTRGGNLDIRSTLYDDFGNALQSDDSLADTNSQHAINLQPGRYFLVVEGVGNADSPYSGYGSLGQYFITGFIPTQSDITAPVPNPMSWLAAPAAAGRDRIAMTATTAHDDSGVVEYRFDCVSGPAPCTGSGWRTDSAFTATGLMPGSTYGFQVLVRDAAANTTLPSVTAFATTAENLAPVAANDSAETAQGVQIRIAVLANDQDPDGDALQIQSVTQGSGGQVINDGTGLTYIPDAAFIGNDTFRYVVMDPYGATASASVTVNVQAGNRAPVALDDSVLINKGDTVVIDVLANDSDADGDVLVITSVTSPGKGSIAWQPGQGTITYLHDPSRKGGDSFAYTVSDGKGGQATATVSIELAKGGGGKGGGGSGKGRKIR